MLQEILHNVGGDKVCLDQKNIIAFARDAFNIDQDTHDVILQSVIKKEVIIIIAGEIIVCAALNIVHSLFDIIRVNKGFKDNVEH